mmetsp:Transcript_6032/g.7361  ORF Transcript_6032/g.7361 Transcript_6032/m.7361 type:complete len:345 (+) Transcript_6032:1057-2091(+)
MTDLTPLFKQCVSIVQDKFGDSIKEDYDLKQSRNDGSEDRYIIKDTFIKECIEFHKFLMNLQTFINEIKSPYLSISDETSYGQANDSLSIDDKNKIDEELQYKIQQLYEKLKLLQTYEQKRQSALPKSSTGWIGNLFGSDEQDDKELFHTTISSHRTRILRSLNDLTNHVSKSFESLQRQRYGREKQLNLLNFQNLEEDMDLNYYESNGGMNLVNESEPLNEQWDINEDEDVQAQQLTQEQIQELDSENQEFLNLKTNQLKQVESLHHSMLDILNLQAELSYQLETQSDQINNLMDSQSQVEIDVRLGNRNLDKATNRNKKGSSIIISTCITLGVLLLFLDYIS